MTQVNIAGPRLERIVAGIVGPVRRRSR